MTQLFGISMDTLATVLVIATLAIMGVVFLLALGNRIFLKIGVRNIPRRRTQMLLIVFALMLSTTLLSAVLATGDVMNAAVQSVAVYNWGNIDEVVQGGRGDLGLFSERIYQRVLSEQSSISEIAAVSASLTERNLLVADQTSRQVRSKVTALAIVPGSEQGFGGMLDPYTHAHLTITALATDQVYLNVTTATLLSAHDGDTLYVYSDRWPGRRYSLRVAGIVEDNGLVGDTAYMVSRLETFQQIEGQSRSINQVFIANRGGGGVNGVALSQAIASKLRARLPDFVHIDQVKQQGVQTSQDAENIFSRIFALFALFALAIGLLLILLIFVLLAAERRAEMGMARAIGVLRRHLVLMYLFEGTVYDLIASFIGLAVGVGAGTLTIVLLGPTLARFNFPLKLTFEPRSLVIAYCLGVIFTFFSVVISSWLVSRMTVAEAMRDLPEPSQNALTLGELGWQFLLLGKQAVMALAKLRIRRVRLIVLEQIPDTCVGFVRSLTLLGFLPLLAGYWLMQRGLEDTVVIPFSLGLSLIVVGFALLLRAIVTGAYQLITYLATGTSLATVAGPSLLNVVRRAIMTLAAACIVAYWALPFDVLAQLGLPRFQGGIEVFFVAGLMMVIGTVWICMTNAELLVRPLLWLSSVLPSLYAITQLASAYPLHRRFRTGLSVIMFSLVIFAMTIMAIITNAMQNTYVDINAQTGGYDIQAVSYFKDAPDIAATLSAHGMSSADFSAVGVRSSAVVGVIQLGASEPRWSLYPAQVIGGGFLQGYGLHLVARAQGFSSDSQVWQALQTHSNYALIDSSALPYNPNVINSAVYDPNAPSSSANAPANPPGFDPRNTFSVSGIYQGDSSFQQIPLWVVGDQIKQSMKVTIIGVIDNSDGAHFGLYIPHSALSDSSVASGSAQQLSPEAHTYYFKVAPGQDKHALAVALGSAYLDNGMETTVLEDAIWQVRGPRILLSNILLGVVGVTLLLGVAALAITGTRAVVERRQQIGMLRALGCRRTIIQWAFLLESFLVGTLGSVLGVVLGLVLTSNIFAANFFEQFNTGLTFSVPWSELAIIVGVGLLASFLGAILPAWQAGRVAPADALRYQ